MRDLVYTLSLYTFSQSECQRESESERIVTKTAIITTYTYTAALLRSAVAVAVGIMYHAEMCECLGLSSSIRVQEVIIMGDLFLQFMWLLFWMFDGLCALCLVFDSLIIFLFPVSKSVSVCCKVWF